MKIFRSPRFNLTMAIIGLCSLCFAGITGCKGGLFGVDPSAPTGAEHLFFTTVTNYIAVPVQVQVTNFVTETQVVFQTNTVGQIVTATNTIQMPVYSVVTITNVIPQYQNTVNGGTTSTVQAAGSVLNTFLPGVGGMVSSGVLALLGLWAQLRSSKRGVTNDALVQEMEAIRNFLKTLPNGAAIDKTITDFLAANQGEAGVLDQVIAILRTQMDGYAAQASATKMVAALPVATAAVKAP